MIKTLMNLFKQDKEKFVVPKGGAGRDSSGATTKITINNRRLNRLEFEQTILIPTTGDNLDEYKATTSVTDIFLGQNQSMAVILMPMQWSFPLCRHKGLVGIVIEIRSMSLTF